MLTKQTSLPWSTATGEPVTQEAASAPMGSFLFSHAVGKGVFGTGRPLCGPLGGPHRGSSQRASAVSGPCASPFICGPAFTEVVTTLLVFTVENLYLRPEGGGLGELWNIMQPPKWVHCLLAWKDGHGILSRKLDFGS